MTDQGWVEERLAHYFDPVREAMDQEYLPSGEPAEYLYDLVREYPSRDAKGLRPAILLATCEAFGGSSLEALSAAASIELLHNALLIHDDIEDGSDLRRGQPALHHQVGLPLAINTGDALAMFALRPLHETVQQIGGRLGEAVMDEFHTMIQYTLEGQALELGWRRDNVRGLGDDDYLRLIMLKTCWYTTVYPMRVGALIGSRGLADLEPFVRFGYFLGAAFQIQDDLLNLVGDEQIYGKELLGDILEGKRTLPLLHLLRTASDGERQAVEDFLSPEREGRTSDDAEWVRALMVEYGSIDYTREFAEGIALSAHDAYLEAVGSRPESAAKRLLEELIPYMLSRKA